MGLLVDQISDVVQPDESMLEAPPPNLENAGAEYLAGVCKTERATVGILNVRALLASTTTTTEA